MNQVPGHIFVRNRWVNCNKCVFTNPNMRCKLGACEINKGDKHDN